MRRRRVLAGSLLLVVGLAGLAGACGPDWDALDPLAGSGASGGGGNCPVNDNNDCTIDVCVDDVTKHNPAAKGTLCGAAGVCNAMGACVECNELTDCPGADDDCRTRTCSAAGACGWNNEPSGHIVDMQVAGDCKKRVCDGMGVVVDQVENADLLDDMKECTVDQCNNGEPLNMPKPGGTACSQGGGKVCNAAGDCVQCNMPTDCGVDSACVKYACTAGMCPANPNLAAGESCGVSARCDGDGACVTCQAPIAASPFVSPDTPLSVPNNNPTGATSTIFASGLGSSIVDVDVNVSITSDASGDLTVTLTSPKGTVIELTSGNGGVNDNNFAGTTFDDDANALRVTEVTYISNVTVLSAIPERNLGRLNGENPNGNWALTVKDAGIGVDPILVSWSLAITAQDGNVTLPTPPPFMSDAPVDTQDKVEKSSPIQVTGVPGFIQKATVSVNLGHKASEQLVITLVSPKNKVIPLSTKVGASDVFQGTTFDEAAPNLVGCTGAGCVTFQNGVTVQQAIPEGALSALVGDDPNGTWTLKVLDDVTGSPAGTLSSWSLTLTPALCPLAP